MNILKNVSALCFFEGETEFIKVNGDENYLLVQSTAVCGHGEHKFLHVTLDTEVSSLYEPTVEL